MTKKTADIDVTGGGSIFLLAPQTPAGRDWIDQNIGQDNGFQPYYPTVLVEHRYVGDIVEGMVAGGLEVE